MHERLTGVPPSATVLEDMRADIAGGNAAAAAQTAMDNSAFYNVTLKNFVTMLKPFLPNTLQRLKN